MYTQTQNDRQNDQSLNLLQCSLRLFGGNNNDSCCCTSSSNTGAHSVLYGESIFTGADERADGISTSAFHAHFTTLQTFVHISQNTNHAAHITSFNHPLTDLPSTKLKILFYSYSGLAPCCCKGDLPFQWETPKFDPSYFPNPLIFPHQNLHRWLCPAYLLMCKIW